MSVNITFKHSAQVSRTGARRIKVTPPKPYFDYTPLARLSLVSQTRSANTHPACVQTSPIFFVKTGDVCTPANTHPPHIVCFGFWYNISPRPDIPHTV